MGSGVVWRVRGVQCRTMGWCSGANEVGFMNDEVVGLVGDGRRTVIAVARVGVSWGG